MDKVIVIGIFEFIGFHFCKTVLEEGVEVEGVYFDRKKDALFEEKQLEIGRNANFTMTTYESWQLETDKDDETVVILNFYDYFIKKNEKQLFEGNKLRQELVKQGNERVIFILPIQVLENNKYNHIACQIEEMVNAIKKVGKTVQTYYLPTVYGPWQLEEFTFQQSFMNEKEPYHLSEREYTADALYIDEAIEAIMEHIEKTDEVILLKSTHANNWEKCASFLGISVEQAESLKKRQPFHGTTITIKEHLSIQKGLEKQRQWHESFEQRRKM